MTRDGRKRVNSNIDDTPSTRNKIRTKQWRRHRTEVAVTTAVEEMVVGAIPRRNLTNSSSKGRNLHLTTTVVAAVVATTNRSNRRIINSSNEHLQEEVQVEEDHPSISKAMVQRQQRPRIRLRRLLHRHCMNYILVIYQRMSMMKHYVNFYQCI